MLKAMTKAKWSILEAMNTSKCSMIKGPHLLN